MFQDYNTMVIIYRGFFFQNSKSTKLHSYQIQQFNANFQKRQSKPTERNVLNIQWYTISQSTLSP